MKKLVLDVEQLRVESYETTRHASGRGTVLGNSSNLTYTMDHSCPGSTCGQVSNAVRCFPGAAAEYEGQDEL